jgi:hypothetical protein
MKKENTIRKKKGRREFLGKAANARRCYSDP